MKYLRIKINMIIILNTPLSKDSQYPSKIFFGDEKLRPINATQKIKRRRTQRDQQIHSSKLMKFLKSTYSEKENIN